MPTNNKYLVVNVTKYNKFVGFRKKKKANLHLIVKFDQRCDIVCKIEFVNKIFMKSNIL